MNKQDWTYKKLGEVCEKASSNIAQNKIANLDGDYPVFGASGFVQNVDFYHRETPYIGIVKDGSGVGRVNIYPAYSSLLGTMQYIIPKEGNLLGYIAYALKGLNLSSFASGAAIPHIYFKDYSKCKIPVPPIAEQERIVAELDLLQGIIEKKKEQLKAYDLLAQSIFYTMFGDPIDNPKGWEVKKLKELCKKITDGTHNSPINTEIGDYKYITAKNIKKDGIILNNITYVSTDIHKAIYERCNPEYGDVLYIKDGITTGIATINTLKEEFSLLSSVALLKPKGCLMNYYLKAVLNMPSQYASIREHMGGAAITRLTIAKINEIRIPVPPLSLQQEFAEKVEAIERQKALVQQSIEETQTMFACTMDKYFG